MNLVYIALGIIGCSLYVAACIVVAALVGANLPAAIRDLIRDSRRPTIHHDRADGPVSIDPDAGAKYIITGKKET